MLKNKKKTQCQYPKFFNVLDFREFFKESLRIKSYKPFVGPRTACIASKLSVNFKIVRKF